MSRGARAGANVEPDPAGEQPIRELAGLRRVEPPPALVARVMTKVAEPPAPTLWQWLRRPFRIEIRMSPIGVLALVIGFSAVILAVVAPGRHPSGVSTLQLATAPAGTRGASTGAVASPGNLVVVRFMLEARGAKHVAVAGSFNDWDPSALPLVDVDQNGVFVGTVSLPPGTHEYMFVVDGEWVTDPAASERRPDGFGRLNSLLRL
jgi:hypothetical protein